MRLCHVCHSERKSVAGWVMARPDCPVKRAKQTVVLHILAILAVAVYHKDHTGPVVLAVALAMVLLMVL